VTAACEGKFVVPAACEDKYVVLSMRRYLYWTLWYKKMFVVLAVCDGMLLTNRILTEHSHRSPAVQYTTPMKCLLNFLSARKFSNP
jgi:hypothetical protein